MLQAHSFLWNYLWVVPNLFLLLLAFLLWKRAIWRQLPAFFLFAILSGAGDLTVFYADISPSVSGVNFWRVDWACLLIESFLKFIVIGEIFSRVLNPYPSVSRLGRTLITGFGAALVVFATLAAAYSHGDSTVQLISGFHLLEQTVFLVELGLIIFLFFFVRYFSLSWDRCSFGVLFGFGLSACGYLSTWAIMTNANPSAHGRTLFDFANMAMHNVCVLIWYYYLLVNPGRIVASNQPHAERTRHPSSVQVGGITPEPLEVLNAWNRELERLIHQ